MANAKDKKQGGSPPTDTKEKEYEALPALGEEGEAATLDKQLRDRLRRADRCIGFDRRQGLYEAPLAETAKSEADTTGKPFAEKYAEDLALSESLVRKLSRIGRLIRENEGKGSEKIRDQMNGRELDYDQGLKELLALAGKPENKPRGNSGKPEVKAKSYVKHAMEWAEKLRKLARSEAGKKAVLEVEKEITRTIAMLSTLRNVSQETVRVGDGNPAAPSLPAGRARGTRQEARANP